MKNITIIILSVVLAHFKLPSASIEPVVGETLICDVASQVPYISPEAAEEEIIIPAEPVEETPVKANSNTATFRAKNTVHIQSAVNAANRVLHQQLESSGQVVLAENVQFAFDDYALQDNAGFNKILTVADKLIFDPALKISISGNTDDTGAEYYNDVLSYNRVNNIKAYLLELGVPENRITVSFNGEHNPVAGNETAEGRAANRRVEMFLYQ